MQVFRIGPPVFWDRSRHHFLRNSDLQWDSSASTALGLDGPFWGLAPLWFWGGYDWGALEGCYPAGSWAGTITKDVLVPHLTPMGALSGAAQGC